MTVQQKTIWKSRRLGHGNFLVSNIGQTMDFYINVCGFEDVFRESHMGAGFVSNGNTHHDLGFVEARPRHDLPVDMGTKPGLNHLAFEVETDADLVEGWRRTHDAGVQIDFMRDHQVTHSIYLSDPDGNRLEVYSDVIKDWRGFFDAGDRDIGGPWLPGETEPATDARYHEDPEIRRVEGAIFHPLKVTHGVLVAADFDAMLHYYTKVVGLDVVFSAPDESFAMLSGTVPGRDLALFRAGPGRPPGLHHLGFEMENERELDEAEVRLRQAGIQPEIQLEHSTRRSIFLKDPDGVRLEFYADRSPSLAALSEVEPALALHLA